jgi:hypothetical protein
MAKADKDVLAACFVITLAVCSFYVSAAMETPEEFIESPGIFPGLMSILLVILGVIFFIRSIRQGGGIKFIQLGNSVTAFFKSEEDRPTILGVLFPGIYVFIAIPLIGFYFSSALFMGVMFYLYVKQWKRWVLFPVSIGITVTLYLVFTVFFQSQIW